MGIADPASTCFSYKYRYKSTTHQHCLRHNAPARCRLPGDAGLEHCARAGRARDQQLAAHQFQALLHAAGPSGRKLDFLLQEMGREINTIGAKCQDANLSHLVVALKAEVERLREQVQNVE